MFECAFRFLKVSAVYVLVGCLLIGNITCAYASSENLAESSPYDSKELNAQFVPIESDHPYTDNDNNTSWVINRSGVDGMRLHFEYIRLAPCTWGLFGDKLILLDKYDKELEEYYGDHGINSKDIWTEYYPVDVIKVRLVTDDSEVDDGFKIDQVQTKPNTNSNPEYNIPPEPSPNPKKDEPSVNLHGEKTEVVEGEDILLKLSAVNLITKPTMHIQAIIVPPSGMSVSSTEFVESGAGQYTTTYELEPGQGRDIEVRIAANQVGDFNVKGRIVYYYDDNKTNGEDKELNLPIHVSGSSASSNPDNTGESTVKPEGENKSPGFGSYTAIFGLLAFYALKKRIH